MAKKVLYLLLIVLMFVGIGYVKPAAADIKIDIDGEDNVIRIFEDVEIAEDKEISGNVVAVMGDVKVDGKVMGDVVAIMGDLEINNYVGGEVVSIMGSLIQGTNADIKGNITEVSVANLSNINLGFPFALSGFFGWYFKIIKLIVSFGLVVLVFSFMPNHQKNMANAVKKEPWRKLFIGIIASLLIPVVILLTALTIIGIPLIPVVIFLIAAAKFIGYVAIVYIVGERIAGIGKADMSIYLQLLLGVAALWILNIIPIFGIIAYLVVTFIALGAVIDTKFGTNRPWFKRKEIIEEE